MPHLALRVHPWMPQDLQACSGMNSQILHSNAPSMIPQAPLLFLFLFFFPTPPPPLKILLLQLNLLQRLQKGIDCKSESFATTLLCLCAYFHQLPAWPSFFWSPIKPTHNSICVCLSLSLFCLQVDTNSLTYRSTSQTQNPSPQKHQTFKQNTQKQN